MRVSSAVPVSEPTEIEGQTSTSTDRIVRINGQRISFRDLAKFAWPHKTEQSLSFLTGYDARTCRRWLTHRTEPPAEALGVVLAEIMKRYHGK